MLTIITIKQQLKYVFLLFISSIINFSLCLLFKYNVFCFQQKQQDIHNESSELLLQENTHNIEQISEEKEHSSTNNNIIQVMLNYYLIMFDLFLLTYTNHLIFLLYRNYLIYHQYHI